MSLTYTKTEIYTEKTIVEYDEFNNVISRNVYYDKEIKYNEIQHKNVADKYYSYKLLNSIVPNTSASSSIQTSPNISPTSSIPSSPTDSVIIDMSKLLYSNTNTNYYKKTYN